MGKLGMALTYLMAIIVGIVFAYVTVLSAAACCSSSAWCCWWSTARTCLGGFFRRDRLKS